MHDNNPAALQSTATIMQVGNVKLHFLDDIFASAMIHENDQELPYHIDGNQIFNVVNIKSHEMIVYHTVQGVYFSNYENVSIPTSELWTDYYYERTSESFYRKDVHNVWYDSEGSKVKNTIVLKRTVLMSIAEKKSVSNQLFNGQSVYASPSMTLLQIGKIVLNNQLEKVYYKGQHVTGLDREIIQFRNGTHYQKVSLGLEEHRYINENTLEPILIDGKEIRGYIGKYAVGRFEYHILTDGSRQFYLSIANEELLDFGIGTFIMDSDFHVVCNHKDVILIVHDGIHRYAILQSNSILSIPSISQEPVTQIIRSNVAVDTTELLNMTIGKTKLVVRADTLTQYVTEEKMMPTRITNAPGWEGIYAVVTIKGKKQLLSLTSQQLINVHDESVSAIDGHAQSKLLNAITSTGRRVVLDLRRGYAEPKPAKSMQHYIVKAIGTPVSIGSRILQNCELETLGGSRQCVVDLNDEQLSSFTLPTSMTSFSEGEMVSVFAGLEITSIALESPIKMRSRIFYKAYFRAYDDHLHTVIIDQESGLPIHLDGLGHKLELATEIKPHIKKKSYYLGEHLLIEVNTLTEDLKKNKVVMSVDLLSSWIPFAGSYLPILKGIVDLDHWEYYLVELRGITDPTEYIAIEKKEPHRILVQGNSRVPTPHILKSSQSMISPENKDKTWFAGLFEKSVKLHDFG